MVRVSLDSNQQCSYCSLLKDALLQRCMQQNYMMTYTYQLTVVCESANTNIWWKWR